MSKYKCKYCGGENVKVDAWVVWDEEKQDYIIDTIFDDEFCPDCDHSGNNISVLRE